MEKKIEYHQGMNFLIYKGNKITIKPFSEENYSPYNSSHNGFVIHEIDLHQVDDNKIHIYFNEPRIDKMKIINYFLSDENLSYPKKIFIKKNSDYLGLEILDQYLRENSYLIAGENEKNIFIKNKQCAFFDFVKHQKTDPSMEYFIHYINKLFISMGADDALPHAVKYFSFFQVALTSFDIDPREFYNYELLESIGDMAAWGIMTNIFLEYMNEEKIEIKESTITAFHQAFASKDIQSKICKEIQLYKFAKIRGEITMSVREDFFEAFTGAMFLINEYLLMFLGVNFMLTEKFLRWAYKAVDFSNFEEKPAFTRFTEYMKMLTGPYNFKERKRERGGYEVIILQEKITTEKFLNKTQKLLPNKSTDEIKEKISKILSEIKLPYGEKESEFFIEKRKKFEKINSMIVEFFGEQIFTDLRNKTFLDKCEIWEREKFLALINQISPEGYIIDMRFFGKKGEDYYWVLQKPSKIEILNTNSYSDSEKPSTVISFLQSLIGENPNDKTLQKLDISNVKKVPVDGDIPLTDYLLEDEKKYTLIGNKFEIEMYLKENLNKEIKYFIKLESFPGDIGEKFSSERDSFIEYSPFHEISFTADFDVDYLRKKIMLNLANKILTNKINFKKTKDKNPKDFINEFYKSKVPSIYKKFPFFNEEFENFAQKIILDNDLVKSMEEFGKKIENENIWDLAFDEYPRSIYSFIGDRSAYSQMAMISLMKHKIFNESGLNIIKNFYRSKNLKDEFTRILNIHENNDDKKPLITYDEILGMNNNIAPLLVNYILSRTDFSKNIILNPKKRLAILHQKLYKDVKPKENKNILFKEIKNNNSDDDNDDNDEETLERKKRGAILQKGDSYEYIDTFGNLLSVKINGHSYIQIEYYFAKYLINYEKKINPQWNIIQNFKFASMPKYSDLSHILKHEGINGWEMNYTDRRKKNISISFEKNNFLYYFKGFDIDSIIKQLPFSTI